jgi:hypothetical protein
MKLETDSIVGFPREQVYEAYRDELVSLVEHLPNVRSIETQSREENGSTIRLVNLWTGGGAIPAALKSVIPDETFAWTDYATWVAEDWRCDWHISSHAFPDAVSCVGTTSFVDVGGTRTRVDIRGELHIDARKLKAAIPIVQGMPAEDALMASMARKIEQFLVHLLTTNLSKVTEGLARYLEARNTVIPPP